MASILEAHGITKKFEIGDSEVNVLKGIDLTIQEGEIVAVTGPSGVGKSTLLHILGGLESPSTGSLSIDSVNVISLTDADRARFRNQQIGFVFQFHHLLSDFTALENVMMPLMIQGIDGDLARKAASKLLHHVGLKERENHLPAELSGGESQRVAVARALVAQPKIVLADEPSGNLDVERSLELHDMVWELARDLAQTFVIVTHDMALADRADRIVRMEDGRIAD